MSVTAMTGSTFLPFGQVGSAIVGLTIIPTAVYTHEKWVGARMARGVSVKDRMVRLEADPAKARALNAARAGIGAVMQARNEGRATLATLRMAAGLSQTQLAQKMETKQGNISRWEKNPGDMHATTILKMARALNVDSTRVLEAIQMTELETA